MEINPATLISHVQPFLEMVFWGGSKRSRRSEIPVPLLSALSANKTYGGQQVVILVQVLAHEINHGYKYTVVPCETFNGVETKNLRHLAGKGVAWGWGEGKA